MSRKAALRREGNLNRTIPDQEREMQYQPEQRSESKASLTNTVRLCLVFSENQNQSVKQWTKELNYYYW